MIAAARPRWLRYRRAPSANSREAVNGDKKESQRQDQGKAQEDPGHQGDYPQKDHDGQKKAGEEDTGPARITRESQADRERCDETDAGGRSSRKSISPFVGGVRRSTAAGPSLCAAKNERPQKPIDHDRCK